MKHAYRTSTHWTLASILGATLSVLSAACSVDETRKPAVASELSAPDAGLEPEPMIEDEEQESSDAGTTPTPSAPDAASPTPSAGLQTLPLEFDSAIPLRSTKSYLVRLTFARYEDRRGYSRHERIDIPVTSSTTSLTIPLPPVPREENFSCVRSATSCDSSSPYRASFGTFELYEDKNGNGTSDFTEQLGAAANVAIIYDDLNVSVLPTTGPNVEGALKKGFTLYEIGADNVWRTPATKLRFRSAAILF